MDADIITDMDQLFNTDELAETCTYNGQSFGVQFTIEDHPSDMFGNIIESAQAHMVVLTKYVADIKHGILVEIGSAPDDDAGSGFAGTGDEELIIDSEDTTFSTLGVYQYYVIKISNYGNNGLFKQIFFSKDRP